MFESHLLNATIEIEGLEFYNIIKGKLTIFYGKYHPKMYPTHQQRFILEQYYQLSIKSYDHFIVFSNCLYYLNAYLEYSQE